MTDTSDLKYTADHEWLAIDGSTAVIGITDYAAEQLGDVVFVELPDEGDTITAGDVIGEIESTKSVGEFIAPIDGTVTGVNEAVVDDPALVNSSPYGTGWFISVEFTELPDTLLDRDAYEKETAE